jgi:hypothetical protein
MSDLGSKKGEKGRVTVRSADKDADLDIENALSFINSEKYQEVPPPIPGTNPSTSGIGAVQPTQQKDSNTLKPRGKEALRPREIEKGPVKKTVTSPHGKEVKKSGKMWLFFLSVTILVLLAIFFLYWAG